MLIVAGNMLSWPWVNSLWFRLAHVLAIGVVVAQAWLGEVCPLTVLESWLRVQAGSPSYSKSFVEHWVQRLLFYEAPFWVFTLAYSVFGLLVLASWWSFPPGTPSTHIKTAPNPSSGEDHANEECSE